VSSNCLVAAAHSLQFVMSHHARLIELVTRLMGRVAAAPHTKVVKPTLAHNPERPIAFAKEAAYMRKWTGFDGLSAGMVRSASLA
jgi:hypothetical protein